MRSIIYGFSLGIGSLAVFGGVMAYQFISLKEQMQETLKSQSYYLAEYSDSALKSGDTMTAALLAKEALPNSIKNPERPFVGKAQLALTNALGVYNYGEEFSEHLNIKLENEIFSTLLSKDGKLVVVQTMKQNLDSNNGVMVDREIGVYNSEDGKQISSYKLTSVNLEMGEYLGAIILDDSSTLVYVAEDGLTAVNVYTNEIVWKGKKVDIVINGKENNVVTGYNNRENTIYFYNIDGSFRAESKLGNAENVAFMKNSNDGNTLSIQYSTITNKGIFFVNTMTGEKTKVFDELNCYYYLYWNEEDNAIAYIYYNYESQEHYLGVYDVNEKKNSIQMPLSNSNVMVTWKDENKLFYAQDKNLYEIDIRTGEIIWSQEFSDVIVDMCMNQNTVMINFKNGSIGFFNNETKILETEIKGNGQTYLHSNIQDIYAVAIKNVTKEVTLFKIKDIQGDLVKDISELYDYTQGEIMSYGYSKNRILLKLPDGFKIFDSNTLDLVSEYKLTGIELSNTMGEIFDSGMVMLYKSAADATFTIYNSENFKKIKDLDCNVTTMYINDDGSIIYDFNAEEGIREIDAKTGTVINAYSIEGEYTKGIRVNDYLIFSKDNETKIEDVKTRKEIKTMPDMNMIHFCEKESLIFCISTDGSMIYIYSLKDNKIIFEKQTEQFSKAKFIGNGKYIYCMEKNSAVYDINTGKKVIDLSSIETGTEIVNIQTNDNCPYLIAFYAQMSTSSDTINRYQIGGYLYNKNQIGEPIADIPNFLALSEDGEVVLSDAKRKLYKIGLYSRQEIMKLAKYFIADNQLTEIEREKYHIN